MVVADARRPIAKRRTAGTDRSAPGPCGRIALASGEVGASADVASTGGALLAARAANSSPDGLPLISRPCQVPGA